MLGELPKTPTLPYPYPERTMRLIEECTGFSREILLGTRIDDLRTLVEARKGPVQFENYFGLLTHTQIEKMVDRAVR